MARVVARAAVPLSFTFVAKVGVDVQTVQSRLIAMGLDPEPLFAEQADGDRVWIAYPAGHPERLAAWNPWQHCHDLMGRLNEVIEIVLPNLPYDIAARSAPEHSGGGPSDHGWSRAAMHCDDAWQTQPKDPQWSTTPSGYVPGIGIRIGHPDTGFTDHSALSGVVLPNEGYDFLDNDPDANEKDELNCFGNPLLCNTGHGTTTGSVIAGRTTSEMSGIAPGAKIVPLRVMSRVWHIWDFNVARAIDRAREKCCDVVSMSFGGLYFEGTEAAIDRAVRAGVIVMAASGNHTRLVAWPALFPRCISVGATNVHGRLWSGSCWIGPVFAAAPGEDVWAAGFEGADPPREAVMTHSGTSLAVANLAGVAALWLSHWGRDAITDRFGIGGVSGAFKAAVERSLVGFPTQKGMGFGIVNAKAVLDVPLTELPTAIEVARPLFAVPTTAELISVAAADPHIASENGLLPGRFAATADQPADLSARELAFHLTDDVVRVEFLSRIGPRNEGSATAMPALLSRASDALRADLFE